MKQLVKKFPKFSLGCLPSLGICMPKRETKKLTRCESFDRTRSWYIGEIHGGGLVFNRLKEDFNKARVNPATLANSEKALKILLKEEHPDLIRLQETVAKLEMTGSEDSAVKILKQAVEKANDEKKPRPHEAYEIEMLLVQMLIFKGELENALKCKCLQDESLKDARRPLYKAIIHKMQGQTGKARGCWDEFVEVQDPPVVESKTEFTTFEEIVGKLQSTIQEFTGGKVNK